MNRSINHLLEDVLRQLGEVTAEEDINVFNTKLAKLFQSLKKDAGATSIKQNYKGTGSRKFRRQLWIRFTSGVVIDIWLENKLVSFGGVVMNGGGTLSKKAVLYGEKTPEQVYAEAMPILKAWASGKAEAAPTVSKIPEEKYRRKMVMAVYNRMPIGNKMLRAKKHTVMWTGDWGKRFGVGNYTNTTLEDMTTPDLERACSVMDLSVPKPKGIA